MERVKSTSNQELYNCHVATFCHASVCTGWPTACPLREASTDPCSVYQTPRTPEELLPMLGGRSPAQLWLPYSRAMPPQSGPWLEQPT